MSQYNNDKKMINFNDVITGNIKGQKFKLARNY